VSSILSKGAFLAMILFVAAKLLKIYSIFIVLPHPVNVISNVMLVLGYILLTSGTFWWLFAAFIPRCTRQPNYSFADEEYRCMVYLVAGFSLVTGILITNATTNGWSMLDKSEANCISLTTLHALFTVAVSGDCFCFLNF